MVVTPGTIAQLEKIRLTQFCALQVMSAQPTLLTNLNVFQVTIRTKQDSQLARTAQQEPTAMDQTQPLMRHVPKVSIAH